MSLLDVNKKTAIIIISPFCIGFEEGKESLEFI